MSYNSSTVNWDTIGAITNPKVSRKIADNITAQIPLLHFLNKIGHKEYESGGREYQFPVFKELATAQGYSGLTVLDNTEADPVTNCIFQRKQLSVPIVLTGTKMLQNSGGDETSIINYMTAQIEIAEESMKNTLAGSSVGIYSSLSDSDVSGITGLQTMLPTSTTTGTYGTLDRSTYSWWRHKSDSVTTGFGTDGLQSMRTLFVNVFRGDEAPTVIPITLAGYVLLEKALTGTLTYNTPSPNVAFGDVGFQHIMFHGAVVLPEANIPDNTAYFLNLKYLKLVVHRDRDMSIREFITPTNQDGLFGRIYWAGNLVCNCLSRQGLLTGSVDTNA